jgi:hypothetical protein
MIAMRRIDDAPHRPYRYFRENIAGDHATRERQRYRRCKVTPLELLDRRGAYRDAINQQCTGIVEQAFAFENFENAVGQLDLAQDRNRRRGIWRRDDGAKGDGGSPGHSRYHPVRDNGDGCRGETYRNEYERRHRQPVVAEIARRRVKGSVEQYGRHE